MKYLFSLVVLSLLWQCSSPQHQSSGHKDHFSYSTQSEWGKVCTTGKKQSPIDIDTKKSKKNPKLNLNFSNSEIQFLSIANLGHTIQANVKSGNNHLTIDGIKYDLLQFHVHTPSEHTWNQKSYDMEIHFVHKNAEGGLAVVGVFIEKSAKANDSLGWVWNELSKVSKSMDSTPINVTKKITDILPKDKKFYSYEGSLTTPPCSEGVRWFVLEKPIGQSEENIKKIENLIHKSARNVQPVNDRAIQSN